jgi:hypothetical protein
MRHPFAFVALVLCEACGTAPGSAPEPGTPPDPLRPDPPSAPCIAPAVGNAPTYTELFDQYFAKGRPGHCATAGCHAEPGFNEWLCGDSKDSCYAGMVQIGLINPKNPLASMIGDPTQSPLSWVNPTGNMPFDATGPFPAGRDAILAWVAACAENN